MTTSLPEVADLQSGVRAQDRRGLLDVALPVPAGWQRGLTVPWYGCGEPILRDKCIAAEDEAHRPNVVTYPSFPIEQGSTCSTLSGMDQDTFARARLDATTEWALGRQLATDQVGTGAPSLADAQLLGSLPGPDDVVWAVACLEQAAADVGYGTPWVLHTSPRGAAFARRYKMMDSTGLSPSGMPWIISPGYPSYGTEDDVDPATVRFWVTGPVWAGVDDPTLQSAIDWRANDDTAYALTAGIVAFDPCINFAYDVTVGACGTPTPPVDTETLTFDWALIWNSGSNDLELWVVRNPGTVFPAGVYTPTTWVGFQEDPGVADYETDILPGTNPNGDASVQLTIAGPSTGEGTPVDFTAEGPYEIEIHATGTIQDTGVTIPGYPDSPVIDSGTVTYTRPVSN